MSTITRTIYGAGINSALQLGIPYVPQEKSTLNEKLAIATNEGPGPDDRYRTNYIVIGNGGHRSVTGADGIPYTTANQHRATDAACFRHIPFVLREISDDLSPTERERYGLRRQESHSGRQYFAYYAKRLNLDSAEVSMQETAIGEDGTQTSQPFVPTNANLNPVPLSDTEQESNVITASGNYVSASVPTAINFNAQDAEELRNVARILYGSEDYAIISEMAWVSGVERIITGPGAGSSSINYREVIGSQVTTFVTTYYQLNMQNNGFTFTADMGVTEPLFAIEESS